MISISSKWGSNSEWEFGKYVSNKKSSNSAVNVMYKLRVIVTRDNVLTMIILQRNSHALQFTFFLTFSLAYICSSRLAITDLHFSYFKVTVDQIYTAR